MLSAPHPQCQTSATRSYQHQLRHQRHTNLDQVGHCGDLAKPCCLLLAWVPFIPRGEVPGLKPCTACVSLSQLFVMLSLYQYLCVCTRKPRVVVSWWHQARMLGVWVPTPPPHPVRFAPLPYTLSGRAFIRTQVAHGANTSIELLLLFPLLCFPVSLLNHPFCDVLHDHCVCGSC